MASRVESRRSGYSPHTISACAGRVKSCVFKVAHLQVFGNWTVMLITWTGRVYGRGEYVGMLGLCTTFYAAILVGVVLKCEACSHSAHIIEFDDR